MAYNKAVSDAASNRLMAFSPHEDVAQVNHRLIPRDGLNQCGRWYGRLDYDCSIGTVALVLPKPQASRPHVDIAVASHRSLRQIGLIQCGR